MHYLFTNVLNSLKRREIQTGRIEMREERMFSGVIFDLYEDDNGLFYQLENVVPMDTFQGQVENDLSSLDENYVSIYEDTSIAYNPT